MTVSDLVASYLELHARDLRSLREIRRRFTFDVIPKIGTVELAKLHRRDILRVLDPIIRRGAPATARRVYADLQTMVRFAVGRGVLDHDVMHGMKSTKAKRRERFLTTDEIRILWQAWPTVLGDEVGIALKFALATGQRIGEIVGLSQDELDLAKATWTIPAERAKNGYEHAVPLSALALGLIRQTNPSYNGRLFRISVVPRWADHQPAARPPSTSQALDRA